MNLRSYVSLLLCLISLYITAQKPTLSYYLPEVAYNTAIPTPLSYLGFEVGEWHVSHDQLVGYMKALDQASDRISLSEYGRSHEGRPMLCLTITATENHARLKDIQAQRSLLVDPDNSKKADLNNLPAVNYMGYSIHGNEPSGSNAAVLMAYYLAAAPDQEVGTMLKNIVILLDPCFNPDGMQRFSSWVNSRKGQNLMADPSADEFNEPWPRGRTNHYWFDLNRDWLVAQQPESQGRVAIFQDWHPNILTDHHEMGSNSTFFFQPGVPSRVNPITPKRNQELTAKIAIYHADVLSRKGIAFYSGENFDDFYYGKGSTYPDAQGCIGILFEQASSRGSAQDTENGLLTFPFTIRNQVLASFSTLKAVSEMRQELNEYLRDFYKSSLEEAAKNPMAGYIFEDEEMRGRELLTLLMRHKIEVRNLAQDVTIGNQKFSAGNAFWVPCKQAQYRLVEAIFARQTTFQDSIFYDISAWTLPDAFGLNWASVPAKTFDSKWVNAQKGVGIVSLYPPSIISEPAYAYLLDGHGYEAPKVVAKLLKEGIIVKVATQAFNVNGQSFPPGTFLVLGDRQPLAPKALMERMNDLTTELNLTVVSNGLTADGPDLGSDSFRPLRAPKVLLLTGNGVKAEDAGEVWYLLDTKYNIPVTTVETTRFASLNLSKYNVLVLADGSFEGVTAEKLREFANNGGTIVATGASLKWLKNLGVITMEFREPPANSTTTRRTYATLEEDRGALRLAGAIFEAELDLTHPLCYGYTRNRLPIFLGDALFVEKPKNAYAAPLVLTQNPLLAGYVHASQKPLLPGAAAAIICGLGRGKVIAFPGNPNFRAFWYGTNRLFANAVLLGNIISSDAVERK